MLRLKVVGRRDEPTQIALPSTVPGMPPQSQWTTVPSLIVISVDENGNPLGAQGGAGPLLSIPAESYEALNDFTKGDTYILTPE